MLFETICGADEPREKWLAARRGFVCASDVPGILGVNKYRPAIEVWHEKVGVSLFDPDGDIADAIELGHLVEPIALAFFTRKARRPAQRWQALVRSTRYPLLAATCDAVTADVDVDVEVLPTDPDAYPLETKAISDRMFEHEGDDSVPEKFEVQCNSQMMSTNSERAAIGMIVGGRRFRWAIIERDEALCRTIDRETRKFWELVERGQMPQPDASDRAREIITSMFPAERTGVTARLSDEADEWDERIREAKQAIADWEAVKKENENKLRMAIGDAERGETASGVVYTYKTQTRKETIQKASQFRVLRRKG